MEQYPYFSSNTSPRWRIFNTLGEFRKRRSCT